MKITELTIGNWVTGKKWRENPFQITRINDGGKFVYGKTATSTVSTAQADRRRRRSRTATERVGINQDKYTFYQSGTLNSEP